jgi:hypothetical protein
MSSEVFWQVWGCEDLPEPVNDDPVIIEPVEREPLIDIGLIAAALGLALLGEWPRRLPIFSIGAGAVFLFAGLTVDGALLTLAFIGVAVALALRGLMPEGD